MKKYNGDCLHKITNLLKKYNNVYFNELKKHRFAYGLNNRLCPAEFSLILLFNKEKHSDQVIKDGN